VTISLETPTNDSAAIIQAALKGLDIVFKPGYQFKKAGVLVLDITPDSQVQTSLFDTTDRVKSNCMMKALDEVNQLFGKNTVQYAVQGFKKKWRLKQAKVSPCYTTNINEVLTIQI
jgi:DNA polymerase V